LTRSIRRTSRIFDKKGTLIKEVGRDIFKTVMNEIGYCARTTRCTSGIRREDLGDESVSGELKLIVKDLPAGDHRNGGIPARTAICILRSASQQHRLCRPRQSWLDRHPE